MIARASKAIVAMLFLVSLGVAGTAEAHDRWSRGRSDGGYRYYSYRYPPSHSYSYGYRRGYSSRSYPSYGYGSYGGRHRYYGSPGYSGYGHDHHDGCRHSSHGYWRR
ncbi:MAG: hypothetical protein ACREQY_17035 [Candidatus Binatia bacterium]